MGLDGRLFPVGAREKIGPADKGSMFADDWFPIQVKQTDKVRRAGRLSRRRLALSLPSSMLYCPETMLYFTPSLL